MNRGLAEGRTNPRGCGHRKVGHCGRGVGLSPASSVYLIMFCRVKFWSSRLGIKDVAILAFTCRFPRGEMAKTYLRLN